MSRSGGEAKRCTAPRASIFAMATALLLIDLQNDFLFPLGAVSHRTFFARDSKLEDELEATISQRMRDCLDLL